MAAAGNKKRRRRRRRGGGFRLVLAFLGIVLIIAAMVAAVTVFFKIREITVTGESRYPDGDLIAATGIEAGTNMFVFNKFSAINRLFESYPYLDEVSIRRRLPDHVEIIITQCVPVAVLHSSSEYDVPAEASGQPPTVAYKDEYFIIDLKGKLLEQAEPGQAPDLCVIEGISLKNPNVGKYAVLADAQKQKPLFLVLNSAIDNDILPNIGVMDFNETYNISFTFAGRFTVKIGTADQLDKKIRYMNMIIDEHLSPVDRGTIDVSNTQTARFIKE